MPAGEGAAHAVALAELFMASRAAAMPWLPVLHDKADTARYLGGLAASHQLWLARDEDETLLGFIAFDMDWVDHLYLAPAAQRRGIGGALLALALADGRARQLWCFAANTPARRFYEAQGFRLVEQTDGAGNEERCPDVRYQHPGGR